MWYSYFFISLSIVVLKFVECTLYVISYFEASWICWPQRFTNNGLGDEARTWTRGSRATKNEDSTIEWRKQLGRLEKVTKLGLLAVSRPIDN